MQFGDRTIFISHAFEPLFALPGLVEYPAIEFFLDLRLVGFAALYRFIQRLQVFTSRGRE